MDLPFFRAAPGAFEQRIARRLEEHFGKRVAEQQVIATLWGGYGQIVRARLGEGRSVIVKAVRPPRVGRAESPLSHRRKLRSYEVEMAFYRDYAPRCLPGPVLPRPLLLERSADEWWFVLEDLAALGYPRHRSRLARGELEACLLWLAGFHARFLAVAPHGLWREGSYWHLETRPEEWARLPEGPLKAGATSLAERLRAARFRTLIHGDAKVENFCFASSPGAARVAAVDFQYVGGGVGTQDVAYFLGSALDESECQQQAAALLDFYFEGLKAEVESLSTEVAWTSLEQEWRELYPIAWADFCRFLQGWSASSSELGSYSQACVEQALAALPELR